MKDNMKYIARSAYGHVNAYTHAISHINRFGSVDFDFCNYSTGISLICKI